MLSANTVSRFESGSLSLTLKFSKIVIKFSIVIKKTDSSRRCPADTKKNLNTIKHKTMFIRPRFSVKTFLANRRQPIRQNFELASLQPDFKTKYLLIYSEKSAYSLIFKTVVHCRCSPDIQCVGFLYSKEGVCGIIYKSVVLNQTVAALNERDNVYFKGIIELYIYFYIRQIMKMQNKQQN